MANNVQHNVTFFVMQSHKEDLKKMREELFQDPYWFDFNKIVPIPVDDMNVNPSLHRKVHWGTACQPYDVELHVFNEKESSGQVMGLKFQTSWTPAIPLLVALSLKYPNVTILVEYASEDIG